MTEHVMNDLRLMDLSMDMIGSHVTGLAGRDSTMDVLTTMPLQTVLDELDEQATPALEILEDCREAKVPHLILSHLNTGIIVDLKSRWSSDIFLRERDKILLVFVEYDHRVLDFLRRVGEWHRAHAEDLPAEEGFPNTYVLRIMAIYHLMTRALGAMVPTMAPYGSCLDEKHPTFVASKCKAPPTGEELMTEWLRSLAKAEKKGVWADLRNPYVESVHPGAWKIVDPASGQDLLTCRGRQRQEVIASLIALARREGGAIATRESTALTPSAGG